MNGMQPTTAVLGHLLGTRPEAQGLLVRSSAMDAGLQGMDGQWGGLTRGLAYARGWGFPGATV